MFAMTLLPLIGLGLLASFLLEDAVETSLFGGDSTVGDDRVTGTPGNDLITGLEGDDDLRGQAGDDTITGGPGSDLLSGGSENDSLRGNNGADRIWGGEGDDRMHGGNGSDTLRGDAGDDVMRGARGNDVLIGGDGDDALLGNAGRDDLQAGLGSDTLYGGSGDDVLTGYKLPPEDGALPGEEDTAPDTLIGERGDDTISGNAGDEITGGPGEDLIRALGIDLPGGGTVTVTDFDPAEDVLLLASAAGADLEFAADDPRLEIRQAVNGVDTNVSFDGVLLAVLQNTDAPALLAQGGWLANLTEGGEPAAQRGSNGDDALTGTAAADLVFAVAGNDSVQGLGGDDTLNGGAGADLLEGGPDQDSLEGADGDDTLWGQAGEDALLGGGGDDVLRGDDGPDLLDGGAGDDSLEGGAGNDTLITGSGADLADGGEGDDVIDGFDPAAGAAIGEDAADRLSGGAGDDTITGNAGDEITGGVGADMIRILGLDAPDPAAVLVTDFDADEDMLILASEAREDAVIEDADALVIRAAENGLDTEVLYQGRLMAVLQGTDATRLADDQSWIGNVFALPTAPSVATPPAAIS